MFTNQAFLGHFSARAGHVVILLFSLVWQLNTQSLADEEITLRLAKEHLVMSKPFNCDVLVNEVSATSEKRMMLHSYYVIQILDRRVISQSVSDVRCSGTAVLSDSAKVAIDYGAYVDREGDWILSYSLAR